LIKSLHRFGVLIEQSPAVSRLLSRDSELQSQPFSGRHGQPSSIRHHRPHRLHLDATTSPPITKTASNALGFLSHAHSASSAPPSSPLLARNSVELARARCYRRNQSTMSIALLAHCLPHLPLCWSSRAQVSAIAGSIPLDFTGAPPPSRSSVASAAQRFSLSSNPRLIFPITSRCSHENVT
jgi:hypothetical protein